MAPTSAILFCVKGKTYQSTLPNQKGIFVVFSWSFLWTLWEYLYIYSEAWRCVTYTDQKILGTLVPKGRSFICVFFILIL